MATQKFTLSSTSELNLANCGCVGGTPGYSASGSGSGQVAGEIDNPCSACPDTMPDAYVINGSFGNDDCTDCASNDGFRIPYDLEEIEIPLCTYQTPDTPCEDDASFISLVFYGADPGDMVITLSFHGDVEYSVTISDTANCNSAHTLTKVPGGVEDVCDWPATVTITPSA